MHKAYFGISKKHRSHFNIEIEAIKQTLFKHKIDLLVFVDKYNFTPNQEKDMMRIAFEEIDDSNLLIVELTNQAIGVGIEVGYAKAKKKPIIYLKQTVAKHSTTVGGSSDYTIEYSDVNQLLARLDIVLKSIIL